MLAYRIICILLLCACAVRAQDAPEPATSTAYERAAALDEDQHFADAGAAYHAAMLDPATPAVQRLDACRYAIRSYLRVDDRDGVYAVVASVRRIDDVDLYFAAIDAIITFRTSQPYVYRVTDFITRRPQWTLRNFIDARVTFEAVPLDEALVQLQRRSRELDPNGQGAWFQFLRDPGGGDLPTVSLDVREMGMEDVLYTVVAMSGYRAVRTSIRGYLIYPVGYYDEDPDAQPADYDDDPYDDIELPAWLEHQDLSCSIRLWSAPAIERDDMLRHIQWQPERALARLRVAGAFLGETTVQTMDGAESPVRIIAAAETRGAAAETTATVTIRHDAASGHAVFDAAFSTRVGADITAATPVSSTVNHLIPWDETRVLCVAKGTGDTPDIYACITLSRSTRTDP